MERWFRDYVAPVLSPMVVDIHHPFPHLPSKSLTVALTLRQGGERRFGLVPIPRALPAFYQLEERGLRYLLTEQIVMAFADTLFDNYQVEEKCVISVTRNADISPEDEDYDVGEDFRAHMHKVLKKRSRLAPVRLEIQGERLRRAAALPVPAAGADPGAGVPLQGAPVHGLCLRPGGQAAPGERRRPVLPPVHPPVAGRAGARGRS